MDADSLSLHLVELERESLCALKIVWGTLGLVNVKVDQLLNLHIFEILG